MTRFPVIKNPNLSQSCKRAAGTKQLDNVCRTLPTKNPAHLDDGDYLQDECFLPILDEVRGDTIFDDIKPVNEIHDSGLVNSRCPNPVFDSLLDEADDPVLDEQSGDVIIDDLE